MFLTFIIFILAVLGVDILTLPFLKKFSIKERVSEILKPLLSKETTAGYFLLACTVASLIIANTHCGPAYLDFWNHSIGGHPFSHWIDDGLMAVFFLLVGLELKRELLYGELKSMKQAILPIFAAIGGMLVPAVIYIIFTWGQAVQMGFGIPMATDIAFVLAILAVLGSRVPKPLKIFLTALAVIDDLGAVIVIAVFYTSNFTFLYLLLALILLGLIFVIGQIAKADTHAKANWLIVFSLLAGVGVWILLMRSGIHASIAGVLVAMAIPSYHGAEDAPAARLEHGLHLPVYFFVLPLFILSNMAIPLNHILPVAESASTGLGIFFSQAHVTGIMAGLLLGKPAGIIMGVLLVLTLRWGALPEGISVKHIVGAGFLGGIGFTMAIFISALSFDDSMLIDTAKLAVVGASVISAAAGTIILSHGTKKKV
ncbi:MAG: Na+/H+ antiporter NhaA [Bacteroidales bacterium]|nr:Na+/H+ antiporter NhaA [Bacteroidales bacterium]